MAPASQLWAVTSGWSGPFQHEVVLVAAPDPETAAERAERAFGDVTQPVCRAKMRMRRLGPLDDHLLVGPIRGGESLADADIDLGRRCEPVEVHASTSPPSSPTPQGR